MTKVRTLAQVEDEIRRSRNAHDASTLSGRSRTEALIAEADRLRKPCNICGLTEGRHRLGCANDHNREERKQAALTKPIDTSQLGRIAIAPNDDRIRADMVREALRRTGDYHMKIAAEFASDEAKATLYRMLNP